METQASEFILVCILIGVMMFTGNYLLPKQMKQSELDYLKCYEKTALFLALFALWFVMSTVVVFNPKMWPAPFYAALMTCITIILLGRILR
jgi:hypothetical protein